jgi:hypothetical protein
MALIWSHFKHFEQYVQSGIQSTFEVYIPRNYFHIERKKILHPFNFFL